MSKLTNPLNNEILNIVDELESKLIIYTKEDFCKFENVINDIKSLPNVLGKNARRMLEIGQVMDELVNLGWLHMNTEEFHFNHGYTSIYFYGKCATMFCDDNDVEIDFEYTSPTWKRDIVNAIKLRS